MRNYIDQASMEINASGKFDPSEIAAAAEYVRRRDRLSNTPGLFDRDGHLAHCAEIFGVKALRVKCAAKTIDKIMAEIDAFENQTIYAIAAE